VRPPIRELTELPGDPLGGSSGRKRPFVAEHIGKANEQDYPFTVANELVAGFIGATLGLRVPPAFPFGRGDETLVLVQLVDRDPIMQQGPPATDKAIRDYVSSHDFEVHGAVLFDLYVANNDRAFGPERRNLLLDDRGDLVLYDQGNACFYRNRPRARIEAGIPRLLAVTAGLHALSDMDHKGNVYRQLLTRWDYVDEWCRRIGQLPDYVIDAAINRIPNDLSRPDLSERAALREFLLTRRHHLLSQIESARDMFPNLPSR
jgi:hypothetical protein